MELLPKFPLVFVSIFQFNISIFSLEIQAKHEERREMLDKRQKAMKELQEVGSFPRRYLKKQVTNDRSAPFVSGKC